MINITDLADYYKEHVLKNKFRGIVVDSSNINIKEGLNLYFMEQSLDIVKFITKDKIIKIKIDETIDIEETDDVIGFNNLYWVSKVIDKKNNPEVEISRLRCPGGKTFLSEQNLCVSNEYIRKLPSNTIIQNRINQLKNNLVFSDGNYEYLIIETFASSSNDDVSIVLHGIRSEATVKIKDGKWIITKSTKPDNKNLSRNIDKFWTYQIQRYNTVNIYEESEAKAALNELEIQYKEGKTILALWDKYSTLEREKKEKLQEELGTMKFSVIEPIPNGRTRVKLNVSSSVWNAFYQNRLELIGERLIFASKNGKPLNIDGKEISKEDEIFEKDKETDEEEFNPFIIKKIGRDRVLEISDTCYLINKDGYFILSTTGNQTMDERRKDALKAIQKRGNHILRALLLAIEDKAESIPSTKVEYLEATTERTKAYLKKNFDIDDLTEEQKRAVSVALNSPDITLIQGPPGTGKTTVIAAICDRLEEESEKEKKGGKNKKIDNKKLFLISAFQNDTVEHIASKINTYGIPTPKIGKDDGAVRAEQDFIKQMKKSLSIAKTKLNPINEKRISIKISHYLESLEDGTSDLSIKEKVQELLNTYEIPSELKAEWDLHMKKSLTEIEGREQIIQILESLVINADEFIEKGRKPLVRLSIKRKELNFTDEENALMTKLCTSKNVERKDLEALAKMQKKYLSQLRHIENENKGDDSFFKEWLNKLKVFFKEKEESSYADQDTFLAAVIESIIDNDLKGNDEHILSSLKEYSRSIAATNQVAGSNKIKDVGKVHNVILEEAARSNPLDLLIPMTRAEDRIILVGDQKQLPHMLEPKIADEAVSWYEDEELKAQYRKAYEESLFGILFNNFQREGVIPKRYYVLKEQFRMHPVIGNFVSELYYNGELKCYYPDEEQAKMKLHGLSFPEVKDRAAVFFDVPFSEGGEESQRSKWREPECYKVLELLKEIFADPNSYNTNVGVITFYAKQRDELLKMASSDKYKFTEDDGDGGYNISATYKYVNEESKKERLRIGTVDSFQGKEFDVVILSTVRSNEITPSDEEQIKKIQKEYRQKHKKDIAIETAKEELLKQKFGFLMLENRLNVAFSRAQKLLIVVGDGKMFSSEEAKDNVEGLYEFCKRFSK